MSNTSVPLVSFMTRHSTMTLLVITACVKTHILALHLQCERWDKGGRCMWMFCNTGQALNSLEQLEANDAIGNLGSGEGGGIRNFRKIIFFNQNTFCTSF